MPCGILWQVCGENRTGEVVDLAISVISAEMALLYSRRWRCYIRGDGVVISAEMALFTKTPEVCRTELDRLFCIFKNGGGFGCIPE